MIDLSTGIKIFVLVILAFVGIGHYRGHCVSQTHLVFFIIIYAGICRWTLNSQLIRMLWNIDHDIFTNEKDTAVAVNFHLAWLTRYSEHPYTLQY